jgi:hypothetical protein
MKKLLVVLFALGLVMGADAQPKINGGFRGGSIGGGVTGGSRSGGVHYVAPRVTVIAPYAAYPYYGYGYGLSPFYSPFYGPRYYEKEPSQLDLQIEDIKNEYSFKISSVKHDKSLAKDDRKQKVRDLKHERDDAIIEAKKSYYQELDDKRNGVTNSGSTTEE